MLRLRELRKAAGLTQTQVAEKVGVTQGTVAEWENGGCYPSVTKLPELARAFNCTVGDLYEADASTA